MTTDRTALGAFLRSRRDRLTPARAGIDPAPGPRRVPGLRKEELAALAGLSVDHYSRIEQGRQRVLSPDIVGALARALDLDEVERSHLDDLAGPLPRTTSSAWARPQHAEPGMLRLITALDHVPVLLLGRDTRVLARNALLVEVLGAPLLPGTNFVEWLFGPDARQRIVNWADFAAAAIGGLRYELGRHPTDVGLQRLISRLRRADPDADRWWSDLRVTDRTSLTKLISHPIAGRLTFGIETIVGPHDPDQRLVVYTTAPDSGTRAVLPLITSWATTSGGESPEPEASFPPGYHAG